MKFGTVLAIAMLSLGSLSVAFADDAPKPKGGAVKGAAVGAVAGHEMGGHTKTGAVAGAVIGHHERKKSEKSIQQGKGP